MVPRDSSRQRWSLLIRVLQFLLGILLGLAVGSQGSADITILRDYTWEIIGLTSALIVVLMTVQHRSEEGATKPPRPDWDSDRSPFPGLEAFTEQDQAVFFGRETESATLVERLHPAVPSPANRVVPVVGPSGVGKSSLVQAGVLPGLRKRRSEWLVLSSVVPGDHPLRSLARGLAADGTGHTVDEIQTAARTNPAFLAQVLDEMRIARGSPKAQVLLIIDQAEELITLSGTDECDRFLDLMAHTLKADRRLVIIVIMRSEFLTAFLTTEHAVLFSNPVTIGALSRKELVEVIEKPAQRAGLTFDPPGLPQTMAADAGGGDALPLLAYALQELCRAAGPGRTLTAEAYQQLGGVAGVLRQRADQVAAELGGVEPSGPVLSTLLKFVTVGENEPTRRRVRRSTLTPSQWHVAQAFIAARLLTSDSEGDDALLDVAHEALFRSWAPLRQAIETSADHLRWRADLERWALDWENSQRQDTYLLRGERLKVAQRWADSDRQLLTELPLVREFLTCSNQADRTTMERLSETIARQALGTIDRDPDHGLLLALTAYEECAPTALALRALTTALVASQLRTVLSGHDDWVVRVAWSPDGRRLATASVDRTARIWDADTGATIRILHGHENEVRGVAWSPDGQRLATVAGDRTVRTWDAETGEELLILRGHDRGVWTVAWSPDGSRLATTSVDRTARIWHAHNGTELLTLHGHDDGIRAMAWSPDGWRIVTASNDRTARIWDAHTGAELTVFHGHDDEIRGVTWSPDGQQLATAGDDRTVRIWDTSTGAELAILHGHDNEVRSVDWSPDGQHLATAGGDRTARIWDAASDTEIAALYGHHGWVQKVAWSPDGHRLATGSRDRTVRIWAADTGAELTALHGHDDEVRGVAWTTDGRRLATASDDRTARIWDTDTSAELGTLRGHGNEVRSVAWSPDGHRLATGSRDRTARIWETDTQVELCAFRGHNGWVQAVAWSPDGQYLATGSRDRTARIWDIHSGTEVARYQHDDQIRSIAWAPDGQRLATAGGDRTARVWDAAGTGTELVTLRGHDGGVWGVAWSPEGQRLVTGSDDRTIRVWDAKTGSEIIVVGAHAKGVESVAWSPDGGRIASAARDGLARIWDATIKVEDLVTRARRRVSRDLTAEERRNLMLPPVTAN